MRGIYARERVSREQLDRVVPEGIDSEAAVSDLQQMIEQEKQLQLDYYRKRGRLESQAASLVDPANKPKVLKSLLEASDGIALERLANLPVEEIRAAQPPPEAAVEVDTESGSEDRLEVVATAPAVAYLHGIEISVAGDYASINAFLARVERQPWRLLWRKIEMDASEYPRISARIAVATLSLEKHWLNL
jgi:MSHA biogenesis protein MshJ